MVMKVEYKEDGKFTKIFLSGSIDEESESHLAEIAEKAQENCIFNLKNLEGLNSLGVKNWVSFFRNFHIGRNLRFEECPSYFILQVNMIPQLIGSAAIDSFFSDLYCPNCDNEMSLLFYTDKDYQTLCQEMTTVRCEDCQEVMKLGEDIEVFLEFLNRDQ